MQIDPAWIAVIGTVFGGAGLKGIESVLSRGKNKQDYAIKLREELREEIRVLKEELARIDHDLDEWKNKYYALLDDFIKAKNDESELDEWREKYYALLAEFNKIQAEFRAPGHKE